MAVQQAWKAVGLNDSYVVGQPDALDLEILILGEQGSEQYTCIQSGFFTFEITVNNLATMDYIPKPGDHISYFSPDFGTKE